MSKEKEVFVDVKTVVQFEQELIKTVKNNQVAVVDVYNSEWGRCKAVVEFLKRLFYENNNLKLFCLDVDAILENYNGAYLSKKKKMSQDQPPDTIPDNWIPLIKARQGFSKPYFLFYKDGKLVHEINGVNAPLIQDYVKDLCAVKIPASEFITNPRLLEVWEENFSAEESEVSWEKWLRQLTSSILKLNVPLDDAERRLMLEALKISPNAREKIVTAENLQNWLGDEEKSILQVFTELLPDYEDRAQKFLIQQQEEERIRAEKEAMERAEEELRKQQRDAQMLIEKQKREEEEELLKADRIAREQFEMSPEHIAQIEQEISTLTTTIQESEQVLKGMGSDAEEILPYSLESLIVSHEFSSFCTEHVNKNQVHPISERHSTVSRVFTALEGVEKILSVMNDLICTLQNVGIKDYIGNISSVLHLSDSETICFAHILMHEINSREHEQAPFVLEILGQYLLTGDAAELTIKSDDGTVPAIYPKLHEICSNPLLPGMMEHMALWIPIMLSEYHLLTELEVGCAMKAPESDADIRTIGAQVCFPFLILEENPQLKNEAEYMNITMKGGFHGLPLIGSAFVQDRSKCYLLKPFTWCRVESVNENSMTVCVDESNHKSEAYGALEDAVKSTNDKWKGLNQIMKALGSWQADSNRVGLLRSRLQELTVKQNTSLDGTKQEDALQGSEHEASMHSELVDDTVNASPESPVEGSPEKKLSTEEKELDEIEKLE